MAVVNPPGWLQNAGSTHTAVQMRNHHSMLTAGNDGSLSLRARGGVSLQLGNRLEVHQAGSPNMTVVVKSGFALITGTESSTQGCYSAFNDADVTVTIAASHASLARIDIIVFKVEDSAFSGVANTSSIVAVTGTPSGSPAVPTAPNNSIILAQVAVAAATTSIVDGNITDRRFPFVAAGGILPVASFAEQDSLWGVGGLGGGGFAVWRTDTQAVSIYDGNNWRYFVAPTANTIATQQTTTSTSYTNLTTTGPTVSVETGTTAKVTLNTLLLNSGANVTFMSFAISGATTVAAADATALEYPGTLQAKFAAEYFVTGLTPGVNTFTAKYRVAAGTGTFADRTIMVQPL